MTTRMIIGTTLLMTPMAHFQEPRVSAQLTDTYESRKVIKLTPDNGCSIPRIAGTVTQIGRIGNRTQRPCGRSQGGAPPGAQLFLAGLIAIVSRGDRVACLDHTY